MAVRVEARNPVPGSYVLAVCLAETRQLTVGRLGAFQFPAGWYLYFGSALNGLNGRVRRHLRRDKQCHWHIDYLTGLVRPSQVWWSGGRERRECLWAGLAHRWPGASAPAPGFGSSDCRCRSHLVQLPAWDDAAALGRELSQGSPLAVYIPAPGGPDFDAAAFRSS